MHTLVRWMRAGVRSLLSRRHETVAERTRSDDHRDGAADPESDGSAPVAADGSLVELSDAEFLVERGITRSDYLLDLLRRHDGRLEQSEVSEAIGWSPATTSRRLRDLEEANVVERYRIGQSNVVFLSDAVPERVPVEADD